MQTIDACACSYTHIDSHIAIASYNMYLFNYVIPIKLHVVPIAIKIYFKMS